MSSHAPDDKTVTGDYYGAEWIGSAWRKHRIVYNRALLPASQLYVEALPLFTRGLVSLPDHQVLIRELRLLERMPQRLGKEQVTHPRGVHDDHANATCGVLRLLAGNGYNIMYEDEDEEPKSKFSRPPEPIVQYGPCNSPVSQFPLEYRQMYQAKLPNLSEHHIDKIFIAAPVTEDGRPRFLQNVAAALVNTPTPFSNPDIERAITAAETLDRAYQNELTIAHQHQYQNQRR